MGHSFGRMSDPLQMSLDEYIAKNRLYINELPSRRNTRNRAMERFQSMKGTERSRRRDRSLEPFKKRSRTLDRYQLRERSTEPLDLTEQTLEPYLRNRVSRRNSMLARAGSMSNMDMRGKRIVQELPRQKSVTRYQGVNGVNERLKKLKSRLTIEDNIECASKLFISNLSEDVSRRDITDLFSEFGEVVSSTVHYSQVGKPLGSADIFFRNKEEAVKAMSEYNGVPLDGKPIEIHMMSTAEELGIRVNRRQDNRRPSWGRRREDRARAGL
ncbi:transformer-2 protein homolog beta [Halyomorpha halys]|uniref:transformer-2 protein homolog beta n=1 Tax=Halyomorpha halys TaxID=286706 RepID=UPI0006D51073|nr:uncharacterized protein LOC106690979 [Halyomorpha halys]